MQVVYSMAFLVKFLKEHQPPLHRRISQNIYKRAQEKAGGEGGEWFKKASLEYLFRSGALRNEFVKMAATSEYKKVARFRHITDEARRIARARDRRKKRL